MLLKTNASKLKLKTNQPNNNQSINLHNIKRRMLASSLDLICRYKMHRVERNLPEFPYFSTEVWIVSIVTALEEEKSAIEFVSYPENTPSRKHSTVS